MYKYFFKRLFDIILSLLALPFVILIVSVFAPIIYFSDKGPVFYNAERVGKHGKIFKMFKLRTMKVDSPDIRNSDGSTYNGEDDPRVTKIGKFLRKTSLDEFPQFLNVLFGEMSLIGPRPDPVDDLDIYTEEQRKKLLVKPGITGYNQAYFRNSTLQDDKFNNDVYYAENISFIFDIKIFFKTIISVLKKDNVYSEVSVLDKNNKDTKTDNEK